MTELERVLYVEDDEDIRVVAQVALEMVGGLTVKVCSSGDQALAEAQAFAPQLILLDVMMPGLDGPMTLAGLRQIPALAETPVLFMTAKVQPSEVEHYKSLGAVNVLSKPFDPMSLADQLKSIWSGLNDG
ncbi:response regulator [Marinobacterium sedimentorum]|jgi:CheY-like chemotaxis protein|uniref:response regulator n=1 Tax=Marinobacterium sedimentorum TaxID=2927804 RepID=UPI0020C70125|nr:response regulator [Marinobacterium sedimentorum]MCP8690402.1 response regulator [Marinobacterium sedimentorum]